MATSPRAWQRMLSGRRLDLLDPTPVDIEIEDIAHGLAFVRAGMARHRVILHIPSQNTRCWSKHSMGDCIQRRR